MGFPTFVSRVVPTSDSSARSKPLEKQPRVLLICHHAATTSLSGILSLFQPGGRTVSATFAIGNTGEIVGCVDPSRRPWTSASKLDEIAITFECANLSTTGWTISDASYRAIATIAAWMDRVYPGFAIDRDHIVGHGELYTRWGESYATACPGGMDLNRVVRDAKALASAPAGGVGAPVVDEEIAMALSAKYVFRNEPGQPREYMLIDEDLPPLAGNTAQRGYRVSLSVADGEAFGVLAGDAKGGPVPATGLSRAQYIKVQEWCRRLYDQKHAA